VTLLTSSGLSNAQTTTGIIGGTNYTKLFSENKDFQSCFKGTCVPAIDVAYQGQIMLVLKSGYIDTIWKGVELAKKDGYKIDGISTYVTTSDTLGSVKKGNVNVLVAMSKG
jgi:hypothetical protein